MSIKTVLFTLCALPAFATEPTAPSYSVVSREANSRSWHSQTVTGTTTNVQRYTELSAGLHYKDAYGNWAESSEQITVLPQGGAAATQGQHKVYFPANIYNGVLEIVTSDGQHLRSRPPLSQLR